MGYLALTVGAFLVGVLVTLYLNTYGGWWSQRWAGPYRRSNLPVGGVVFLLVSIFWAPGAWVSVGFTLAAGCMLWPRLDD